MGDMIERMRRAIDDAPTPRPGAGNNWMVGDRVFHLRSEADTFASTLRARAALRSVTASDISDEMVEAALAVTNEENYHLVADLTVEEITRHEIAAAMQKASEE